MTGAEGGRCRSCGSANLAAVVDLGEQPPAWTFPSPAEAPSLATWPLATAVCRDCWLMQLLEPVPAEPPATALHATTSSTMAAHGEAFVSEVLARAGDAPRIAEMASHGGHLAPRFAARGQPTLLVDASPDLVAVARQAGLDAIQTPAASDLAEALGERLHAFDVVVDNYLLAHQRRLDDQLALISALLADGGLVAMEFDHLLPVLTGGQFDAIRHGHFSYLSVTALQPSLERHGLQPLSASAQPVYGGAVRLWARRGQRPAARESGLSSILEAEVAAGLTDEPAYRRFAGGVATSRHELHAHLAGARAAGRRVVGYGAPSRASTLLNACGITPDLLAYTADLDPAKQGRLLPGSGVPIVEPARIGRDRPDEVLILVWDIADEIVEQLAEVRGWGGGFVVPLPAVQSR